MPNFLIMPAISSPIIFPVCCPIEHLNSIGWLLRLPTQGTSGGKWIYWMLNEENEQWPFVDHPSVTIEIQDKIFCFKIRVENYMKIHTYGNEFLVDLVKCAQLFHDHICNTWLLRNFRISKLEASVNSMRKTRDELELEIMLFLAGADPTLPPVSNTAFWYPWNG